MSSLYKIYKRVPKEFLYSLVDTYIFKFIENIK